LVVLEAMACGRPVVGMKAGAIAELVDDQVGIAATAANGATFARAIRDLYDRDLTTLGLAARARVQAQYTWNQALQHQQAVYTSLVEKKRSLPDAWATASRLPSGDHEIMPAGPSSS
jgi:alpha-1,6-mannosyltransferase